MVGIEDNSSFLLGDNQKMPLKMIIKEREKERGKQVGCLETWRKGLPCGCVSVCQCRGCRFNSWSKKIPHATGQLSPCATITGPCFTREGTAMSSPCTATREQPSPDATRESPHTAMKTQCSQNSQ